MSNNQPVQQESRKPRHRRDPKKPKPDKPPREPREPFNWKDLEANRPVFGWIGGGLGFVLGYIMGVTAGVNFTFQFIFAFFGAGVAIMLSLSFHKLLLSDFARSSSKYQRNNRIAAGIAFVAGIFVGVKVSDFLGISWLVIPVVMILMAIAGGVTAASVQNAYAGSKLSEAKRKVPVIHSFVKPKKEQAVRRLLKTDSTDPEMNDTEARVITDWHGMKFIVGLIVPSLLIMFFLWGSRDFEGYKELIDWFTTGGYPPLMLLGGLLTLTIWYLYRNRRSWKRLTTKSVILFVIAIGFFWGYFQFPGKEFIADAFKSGKPEPWYAACGLVMVWVFIRYMIWKFGFLMATDKRIILGLVLPFPLPSPRFRVPLGRVQFCIDKDTVIGKLMGYGTLELDTAGQWDFFLRDLHFVRGHETFADNVTTT